MDEHAKPSNGATDGAEGVPPPAADESTPEDSSADSSGDAVKAMRSLVEQLLEEGITRVRGEGGKLGGRASQTFGGLLAELGVAQRRDQDDLELRVAQLEHRVRLLEGEADATAGVPAAGSDEPSSADA